MYLLGTSWLSNLSTQAVFRVTKFEPEQRHRYVLHLTRSDLPYKSAKLPHMFRIGIMLAEIALLEALLKIEEKLYKLWTFRTSQGDTVEYPYDRMISMVKKRMSPDFGRAVNFCLQGDSSNAFSASETLPAHESDYDQRIKAYAKVLTDYREQVYTK